MRSNCPFEVYFALAWCTVASRVRVASTVGSGESR
jgi:hypothetical protein